MDEHSSKWHSDDIEEHFFGNDRKITKEDKKRAQAKDRSKYKKTDLIKQKQRQDLQTKMKVDKENLLQGRVLSIIPQGIIVEYEKQEYRCVLRGLLKLEKGQHKNIVTVGDIVLFHPQKDAEGIIAHVEPRRSTLSRADNLSRRKEQLIAANIDQVIITVSVVMPELKPTLVDRYIIATIKGNMQPIIVVNKIDLIEDSTIDPSLREAQRLLLDDFIPAYQQAGIPVIPVSIITGQGLEALHDAMKDKASVFSGQSGVGKSSLIREVTGIDLKVGTIVERTKKGSHTTTTTQLIPLPFGGWCIDTPGIKSFGVWNLSLDQLEHYFDDIFELGHQCKFPDCTHTHEEQCAVLKALEAGTLSPLRYESYVSLMESIGAIHYRR